jgi:hypothetical protein
MATSFQLTTAHAGMVPALRGTVAGLVLALVAATSASTLAVPSSVTEPATAPERQHRIVHRIILDEHAPQDSLVWSGAEEGWSELELLEGNESHTFTFSAVDRTLRVNRPALLDFETSDDLRLTLRATEATSEIDRFRSSFAASALESGADAADVRRLFEQKVEIELVIQLRDVNEPPHLSQQQFTVSETSRTGSRIGSVIATDPDIRDQLRYRLVDGGLAPAIALDPVTGVLSVADADRIDFEHTARLSITVEVQDARHESAQLTIPVSVEDVDEAPVVTAPGQLHWTLIPDNYASVGTVTAIDPEDKGSLTYSITDDPSRGGLEIDELHGDIFVVKRAQLAPFDGQDLHVQVAVADSTGQVTSVPVTLSVPEGYGIAATAQLETPPGIAEIFLTSVFPFTLCGLACFSWLVGLRAIRRARQRANRAESLARSLIAAGIRRLEDEQKAACEPQSAAATTPEIQVFQEPEEEEDTRDIEAVFDSPEDRIDGQQIHEVAHVADHDEPTRHDSDDDGTGAEGRQTDTLTNDKDDAPRTSETTAGTTSATSNPIDDVLPLLDAISISQQQTIAPQKPVSATPEMAAVTAPDTAPDTTDGDNPQAMSRSTSRTALAGSSFAADLLRDLDQSQQSADRRAESMRVEGEHSDKQALQEDSDVLAKHALLSETHVDSPEAPASPSDASIPATPTETADPGEFLEAAAAADDDSLCDRTRVTQIQEHVSQFLAEEPAAEKSSDQDSDSGSVSDASLGRYLAGLFANKPSNKSEEAEAPAENKFKPTSFIESYMQSGGGFDSVTTAAAQEPIAKFHRDSIRGRTYEKMDLEQLRNSTQSFREISKMVAHSALEHSVERRLKATVHQRRLIVGALAACGVGIVLAGALKIVAVGTAGKLLAIAAGLIVGEVWLCRRRIQREQMELEEAARETAAALSPATSDK